MELVGGVLVVQELDKGGNPEAGVTGELTTDRSNFLTADIEEVGGEERAEVGNCLFGGGEVAFREGAEHLVGMELLVELTLPGRVVLVAREQGFGFAGHAGGGDGQWTEPS